MKMRLFTKDIDKKLFAQYRLGDNLEKQKVVAKIFNPYGRGRWYLLNSDPEDPDYLWAIVELAGEVEIGSVSRSQLESIKVPPFGLPLERDLYFSGGNAKEVYTGLLEGKRYDEGGEVESENKEMVENQVVQFRHHADELESALKKVDDVDAWVVAKSQRATTDLSDITHYIEGEAKTEKMDDGGSTSSIEDIYKDLKTKRINTRAKIISVIGIDDARRYNNRDFVVNPFSLIEGAVLKGFISVDEIDKNLWNAAVEEAEDIDSDYSGSEEGIGSSDMNAFIYRMLGNSGIKMGVVDNTYQRMESGGYMEKGGKTKEKEEYINNYLKERNIDRKKAAGKTVRFYSKIAGREFEKMVLEKLPYRKYKIVYQIPFGAKLTETLEARTSNEAKILFRKRHGKDIQGNLDKIVSITVVKNKLDSGGMMAKGGKIGAKIKYQGKDAKIVSKKGDMYFVEVMNYHPNGDSMFTVLRENEIEEMGSGGYMANGGELPISNSTMVGKIVSIKLPNELKSFRDKVVEEYSDFIMGKKGVWSKEYILKKSQDGSYMAKGGKLKVGDEGMYEGGEAVITKISDSYYEYSYLNEDGNADSKKMTSPKAKFENQFRIFPKMSSGGSIDESIIEKMKKKIKEDKGSVDYSSVESVINMVKTHNDVRKGFKETETRSIPIINTLNLGRKYGLFVYINDKRRHPKSQGYWLKNKLASGDYMASEGEILKEGDYVWNALGKKLIVDKVTKDEYFLVGFGQPFASPFSKEKVNNYILSGEWSLKPKMLDGGYMAKGGKTKSEDVVYIEFRNANKKFAIDKKYFRGENAYKDAVKWGRKNLGNFNMDMVKFEMADGGYMAKGGATKDKKHLYKTKVEGAYGEYYIVVNAYDENDALERTRYWSATELAKLIGKPIKTTKKFVDGLRMVENQYWRVFSDGGIMASGGVTFADKVKSIKSSLLKRKKVSPKVQKDYGKTYSPEEAEESAKRIVGSRLAKERMK